jgi:hypothetical protein
MLILHTLPLLNEQSHTIILETLARKSNPLMRKKAQMILKVFGNGVE